ncbi:aminoglycoside phosphotransferase family protein [Lentzea sp. BCCO 10_0856]|uniref:Aminoglycoside phosphotransferase family protein n=1 Tax=Lentzea miocenica TaxID=3095431 RepID=A0ABU4T1G4_9PSEU|nr:aminoglycoside phosphotransferase family protein [Lentzea sp. BCCO 10_0856]MDX8031945.1 aminoglycoside phosphotransferase family protein [Lentzea sp. BCCO 10_0856]
MTARLAVRFGPGVAAWCAEVPDRVARLAQRWGLEPGEELEPGAVSVVLRCRWADGTPAVLKLSPDHELLAAQTGMLGLFAASGRVPAVLAADGDAVVLREVLPGTLAEDLPFDGLPRLWADLLAALHGVPARPVGLLRTRCEESFARIGRRLADPVIGARISAATWERAERRCERLLDTQTSVLLHGDLHLGNALVGEPGLMAIDPKACLGDPCFDAADLVVAGAGQEGVATRCEVVAAACGLDGDRLFGWSQVIAPMLAIAHLTHGGPEAAVEELLTVSA